MKARGYLTISVIVIFVILLPIFSILVYSFGGDSDTLRHLLDTVLWGYVYNTLKLILYVSILSLVFGISAAYITTFYSFRFDKTISILLAMPFVIPTYIMGYIYSDIFGFYGPVHMLLKDLGLPTKSYFDVLHFNTIVVILSLVLYPYIYLIVKSSFLKNSTALLYPALSLGKNRYQLFWKVILPLSRPAIAGSLALVVMEVVNEYGAVAYYGVDTLSTAIFSSWFGLNDPKSAAFLSIIAMSIILVLLAVEKLSRGGSSYRSEPISKELVKDELKGIPKVLAYVFLFIPIFFGFVLPFIWIVIYSFKYATQMIDDEFLSAIVNSFVSASVSALIIIMLSFFISYSIRISGSKQAPYLSRVASMGYAIPGVVIGVGVLTLFGGLDSFLIELLSLDGLLISGTVVALIFGYSVRFLAVGISTIEGSYDKVSININKASRNLGFGFWKTLWSVEFPIMKKTLLFGFLLVFVDVIKELPLTLVVRPFNYETLATKTYDYADNTMVQESAIYALIIVLLCFIPMIISNKGD
ncbi:MAG: iron ABC transporter permease [Sulfurovum sp.]|nr:iron ABC transporter permease [Sulfurovum sp.]